MTQKQKEDLGVFFLRVFTREIIRNTPKVIPPKPELPPLPELPRLPKLEPILEKHIPLAKPNPTQTPIIDNVLGGKPNNPGIVRQMPQRQFVSPVRPMQPMMPPMAPSFSPKPMQAAPPLQVSQENVPKDGFGKIDPILKDPSVMSIEVPGPGKRVLVNRGGKVQPTSLMLLKDDIDRIINHLSEKTRIPVVPGLFKAVYGDLVMTAVVSDFVGSRFLIQKRNPFSQY